MIKFNAEIEVNKTIEFIREYYKENNLKGVVLGISGGKDSAVVAALFSKALGPENVIGVTLPCHSEKIDRIDAVKVANKYGFELINLDLTSVYDMFQKEIYKLDEVKEENLENSTINLKPRLRMSSLYYLAAMYSKIKGGTYLVAGTSNKCELFVGYFTKGGDSTHDIEVISDFTVDEVIKLGEYLEVPRDVLHKVPSDGLSNQTDEDKLGVSYKDIAKYMNDEFSDLDEDTIKKIEKLHKNAGHKFFIPSYQRIKCKYMTVSDASMDGIHFEYVNRYFDSEYRAREDALLEEWNYPYKLYVPVLLDEKGDKWEYKYKENLPTARDVKYYICENDKEKFMKITEGYNKEKIALNAIKSTNISYDNSIDDKVYLIYKDFKWEVFTIFDGKIENYKLFDNVFDACVEAKKQELDFEQRKRNKKTLIRKIGTNN